MGPGNAWTYRRLYVGTVRNGLDRLIADLLPEVLRLPGLRGWFFLRFADPGGVHLRLRVRLAPDRVPGFDRLCGDALQALPRQPPFLYRPALRMAPPAGAMRDQPVIRIARGTYVPETDKFGATGIAHAETLFQASSGIALRILQDEDSGGYSRKAAILALMDAARDSFAPEIDPARFWDNYARIWFARAGDHGDALWRGFTDKAARLADTGALDGALQVPEGAAPHLQRWHAALRDCAAAYRRDRGESPPPAILGGNFAHLMNNRLGLFPLEDAYYAVLLHQALVGVRQDA